ncbi:MAG: iron-sulfur cluster repair di-iron protein [Armatimonadota bacterium]
MVRQLLEQNPTLAEVAIQYPPAMRVFDKLGIDYCCGGNRPISYALSAHGVSLDVLADSIESACAAPEPDDRDWTSASLTELADYIEAKHHAYLRSELPRLTDVIRRVLDVHRARHGHVLTPLQETFLGLRSELEAHLMKEENVLFPMIRAREADADHDIHGFPIEAPISVMRAEHESAAEALETMRDLTSGYSLPNDACPSFHDLYLSLQNLERDLHRHIHLENNILFPKAVSASRAVGWL